MDEILATFRPDPFAGKGTVEDLVGATIFFCSPAALFVTATTLPVDGGYVVSGF